MDSLKPWVDGISAIANILTIIASTIAIFVFFKNRKDIATAIATLVNWSYQTTLADIIGKLDRISEYNANEPSEIGEIRNILHEIAGQFRGNPKLLNAAPKMPDRLESLAAGKKLTEPNKRSIVAEVREVIRNIKLESTITSGVA